MRLIRAIDKTSLLKWIPELIPGFNFKPPSQSEQDSTFLQDEKGAEVNGEGDSTDSEDSGSHHDDDGNRDNENSFRDSDTTDSEYSQNDESEPFPTSQKNIPRTGKRKWITTSGDDDSDGSAKTQRQSGNYLRKRIGFLTEPGNMSVATMAGDGVHDDGTSDNQDVLSDLCSDDSDISDDQLNKIKTVRLRKRSKMKKKPSQAIAHNKKKSQSSKKEGKRSDDDEVPTLFQKKVKRDSVRL
jgi:hypothetical protein